MTNKPLIITIILTLALTTSRIVFASSATINNSQNPRPSASENAQVNSAKATGLAQELQPTPIAPEVITQNAVPSDNQIFLPVVNNSQETTSQSSDSAASYYVSPSGNDANPGTLSQPWRTIQKAANTLVAGNSVKILAGTCRPSRHRRKIN